MRSYFGCLPDEVLDLKDLTSRWFVLGKERFERELNLEKVLKTLRNLRILTLNDKEKKARLALESLNSIEVDSDDIKEASLPEWQRINHI